MVGSQHRGVVGTSGRGGASSRGGAFELEGKGRGLDGTLSWDMPGSWSHTSVWLSRATSEASRATSVSMDVMFHWLISAHEYRYTSEVTRGSFSSGRPPG